MGIKKMAKWLLIGAMGALLLCGCSKQTTTRGYVEGLEQLGKITVISREEGSGTRSVFAQELGFEKTTEKGNLDETREDAVIVAETDSVFQAIKNDKSAIGYVSYGSFQTSDEYSEGVRILDVDGTNIDAAENYPLSRSFYLTYSGTLDDLEQDFITYILGKGQNIVAANYNAVKKSTTFLSNQSSGTLKVGGSSSMAPLVEELAKEYMTINKNAVIEVITTDSDDGINGAMSGNYQLGMASRSLKDYEKELLSCKEIAQDKIAVIVQKDNPLKEITSAELKNIFTGAVSTWQELNK